MTTQPDVLVLGGGVIGLTTAYYLARDGARVALLDRADLGQEASWAGAGIIPPGVADRARTPHDQIRARSAEAFPAFSAELRDLTGIDNGYLACGGIEFLEPDEVTEVTRVWAEEGVAFEPLTTEDVHQREPALGELPGEAYWIPGTAQIRNPWHIRALIAACTQLGVELHPATAVHGFETLDQRIVTVHTPHGSMAAGQFLVSAGAWTDEILAALGPPPGVKPVRGQIVLLHTEQRLFGPVLLHGKHYLVPRTDGRVLVGATEEDAGFVKQTTATAVAGLIALAGQLVPALRSAAVEACWAGLRPGSPDGLPFLGPVPGWDNLFVAAGHFRAGLQMSPATGRLMADCLLGRELSVPLEAFRMGREPMKGFRPAFRS
jgi:glycine oxidase